MVRDQELAWPRSIRWQIWGGKSQWQQRKGWSERDPDTRDKFGQENGQKRIHWGEKSLIIITRKGILIVLRKMISTFFFCHLDLIPSFNCPFKHKLWIPLKKTKTPQSLKFISSYSREYINKFIQIIKSHKNKFIHHLKAFIVLAWVFWLLFAKKSLEAVAIKSSSVM